MKAKVFLQCLMGLHKMSFLELTRYTPDCGDYCLEDMSFFQRKLSAKVSEEARDKMCDYILKKYPERYETFDEEKYLKLMDSTGEKTLAEYLGFGEDSDVEILRMARRLTTPKPIIMETVSTTTPTFSTAFTPSINEKVEVVEVDLFKLFSGEESTKDVDYEQSSNQTLDEIFVEDHKNVTDEEVDYELSSNQTLDEIFIEEPKNVTDYYEEVEQTSNQTLDEIFVEDHKNVTDYYEEVDYELSSNQTLDEILVEEPKNVTDYYEEVEQSSNQTLDEIFVEDHKNVTDYYEEIEQSLNQTLDEIFVEDPKNVTDDYEVYFEEDEDAIHLPDPMHLEQQPFKIGGKDNVTEEEIRKQLDNPELNLTNQEQEKEHVPQPVVSYGCVVCVCRCNCAVLYIEAERKFQFTGQTCKPVPAVCPACTHNCHCDFRGSPVTLYLGGHSGQGMTRPEEPLAVVLALLLVGLGAWRRNHCTVH